MDRQRILVVDDEQDLCDILLYNLRKEGYEAEAAYSAEEALAMQPQDYHLLLLDVMMPGKSGFELAQLLKTDDGTRRLPIIFLTAKDTEDDMLHGFHLGADDYVSKPFSVREVMARVKAVLGRTTHNQSLSYQGLSVDLTTKTATADGEPLNLTKTELELLVWLMSHRGQVFSRQQLLDEVWPKDVVVTERTVDVNMARLRKKIGRYAQCIVARQGYGYCFEEI
ncbi:MAG: response regulator transcription factor [Prevotella sp.]|nr:response regulator transcription factor [Prevotella sp.]